jgi:hypothetical protein
MLSSANGLITRTNDYVYLGFDERCCVLRKLVDPQFIPLGIDQKILPFNKPLSTKLVVECDMVWRISPALL